MVNRVSPYIFTLFIILCAMILAHSAPAAKKSLADIIGQKGRDIRPGMMSNVVSNIRIEHETTPPPQKKVTSEISNENVSIAEGSSLVNDIENHQNGEWIRINSSGRIEGSGWIDNQNKLHLLNVNLRLDLS